MVLPSPQRLQLKGPNVGELEATPVGLLLVVGGCVVLMVGAEESEGIWDTEGAKDGSSDLEGVGVGGAEGARVGAGVLWDTA